MNFLFKFKFTTIGYVIKKKKNMILQSTMLRMFYEIIKKYSDDDELSAYAVNACWVSSNDFLVLFPEWMFTAMSDGIFFLLYSYHHQQYSI